MRLPAPATRPALADGALGGRKHESESRGSGAELQQRARERVVVFDETHRRRDDEQKKEEAGDHRGRALAARRSGLYRSDDEAEHPGGPPDLERSLSPGSRSPATEVERSRDGTRAYDLLFSGRNPARFSGPSQTTTSATRAQPSAPEDSSLSAK